VWLQASTATIYARRYDAANDERNGVLGGAEPDAPETWRFSIDVARAWERACDEAATPATRKVVLRSAMTMSPDEGGGSTRRSGSSVGGWAAAPAAAANSCRGFITRISPRRCAGDWSGVHAD
jgi:hypothetical protein